MTLTFDVTGVAEKKRTSKKQREEAAGIKRGTVEEFLDTILTPEPMSEERKNKLKQLREDNPWIK